MDVMWRCGEQGLKIFCSSVPALYIIGRDTKNFAKRGLPLEQAERPCEPLDTAHFIAVPKNITQTAP